VQNCLHKVVRDPLFELFIMACIICNTVVLAIEHHGMSENVRNILDVGNKVNEFGIAITPRHRKPRGGFTIVFYVCLTFARLDNGGVPSIICNYIFYTTGPS